MTTKRTFEAPAALTGEPRTVITPVAVPGKLVTRQEWVYRQLKHAILDGQFDPGRSVTLRGIASMLGVSLTPVREALRRLVAEQALESKDNRRISVPNMTPEKLAEICSVRVALETLAAERALPSIDKRALAHLWWLNEQVDEAIGAADIAAYLSWHREFHYTIYSTGNARVVMPLIESVWLQFSPFMRLAISYVGVNHLKHRHEEALQAVERRDTSALHFALEADVREDLASLTAADWNSLKTNMGR